MSYDLTLFRVPDGEDPLVVYQQIMELEESKVADLDAWLKRPVTVPARANMQQIADDLKAWRPALEQFEPAQPLPWIELNDIDLEVQFTISEGTASVTMPYFRDRVLEMMTCVAGSFGIFNMVAGYSAYDPQLERLVTIADLSNMIARYQQVDQQALATGLVAVGKKPWWKFW